jgi:multidrug efflux pump subunit AcrA (membrane-fusion protein)
MPPDSLSRGRAAMMSLATLLLVAACGDHDTTPLEAAAPSTSTAEPAASGTVPAVQARNTWTRQTDVRVQVGGQPRLAIIGGFGHHWQYAP